MAEIKSYDKRDRAIKAAVAELGANAKEGTDYELSRTADKRYIWTRLAPIIQPTTKARVYDVSRPGMHGTVTVAGANVSEVKWDDKRTENVINKFLKPVEDVPDFLKVENRKPLTPEQKANLEKLHYDAARLKAKADIHRDFNVPKNVEPAGLEIIKASGLKPPAKEHANGSAEPKVKGKRGPRSNPFPSDGKITIVNKSPGFRPGTVRQNVYDHYKTGMTVAAAISAGVPLNHMKWHAEQGWIKIEGAGGKS